MTTAGAAAPASPPIRASEALQKKLAKIGLLREADLLVHLPLRYEDETRITPVNCAFGGEPVQVEVVVHGNEIQFRPRRQMIVRAADESGEITLRFFSFYPNQQAALSEGSRIRAFGEVRGGFFGAEMVHPRFRKVRDDEALPSELTPIYPSTAGLANSALQKLIGKALAVGDLSDTLPDDLRQRLKLPALARSLRFLHTPPPGTDLNTLHARNHPAWRRVKFDEVLAQQLSLRRAYLARREQGAPVLVARDDLGARLLDSLPFGLTGAQLRAMAEIADDLAQPYPMQRLLQGDVGAGKTIVAALAACQAISAGWQAAFMAPTEILAEQHFSKLIGWLEPLGIQVARLSGSQKKKERREMLERIESGAAALVVGTHAVIQEQVKFRHLALAIIDEQHRFGVAQRLALRGKMGVDAAARALDEAMHGSSERADMPAPAMEPHLLMMSATPIPRTLAMSYYADLDVSTLDELPPGRTPVVTKVVSDHRRDEVIERIRAQLAQERQVYWVCPLIEESEALDLSNATETHAELSAALPGVMVGLLHSRMAPAEKKAVMDLFKEGLVGVLVSTTVIEVGVDVPNASLMVIEHAERFGLSQLHQLRGRVGRGAAASACVLMYSQPEGGRLSEASRERLKAMAETHDGFDIARRDLEIRGPGEFLGARQSGAALLRFADLATDADLLEWARALAPQLLDQHPALAQRHVERWLGGKSDYLKA